MIDTDKYEGHTPAPWEEGEYTPSDEMIERFQNRELQGAVMQQGSNIMLAMIGLDGNGEKDRLLMADAPLLLAEVKRLRKDIADLVICWDNSQDPSWFMLKYYEMAQTMWKEGKTWFGKKVIE